MAITDPTSQQAIHAHYSQWLEENALERSAANGGMFAFMVTRFGKARFEGLKEDEICSVIGGVRYVKVQRDRTQLGLTQPPRR